MRANDGRQRNVTTRQHDDQLVSTTPKGGNKGQDAPSSADTPTSKRSVSVDPPPVEGGAAGQEVTMAAHQKTTTTGAPLVVPSTLEVDYDTDLTDLYESITRQDWDRSIRLCARHPQQAATWVVRRYQDDDGDDEEEGRDDSNDHKKKKKKKKKKREIMWRFLPIHSACARQPPAQAIEAILHAYPDGAKCVDDQGMYALHYACGNQASRDVVRTLLAACPEAAKIPDPRGMLPIHYLACWGPSTTSVLDMLLVTHRDVVSTTDLDGKTPLDLAYESDYPERDAVIQALRKWVGRSGSGAATPSSHSKTSKSSAAATGTQKRNRVTPSGSGAATPSSHSKTSKSSAAATGTQKRNRVTPRSSHGRTSQHHQTTTRKNLVVKTVETDDDGEREGASQSDTDESRTSATTSGEDASQQSGLVRNSRIGAGIKNNMNRKTKDRLAGMQDKTMKKTKDYHAHQTPTMANRSHHHQFTRDTPSDEEFFHQDDDSGRMYHQQLDSETDGGDEDEEEMTGTESQDNGSTDSNEDERFSSSRGEQSSTGINRHGYGGNSTARDGVVMLGDQAAADAYKERKRADQVTEQLHRLEKEMASIRQQLADSKTATKTKDEEHTKELAQVEVTWKAKVDELENKVQKHDEELIDYRNKLEEAQNELERKIKERKQRELIAADSKEVVETELSIVKDKLKASNSERDGLRATLGDMMEQHETSQKKAANMGDRLGSLSASLQSMMEQQDVFASQIKARSEQSNTSHGRRMVLLEQLRELDLATKDEDLRLDIALKKQTREMEAISAVIAAARQIKN